jgi:DMSO reductase family type II enzyme heme b subunit
MRKHFLVASAGALLLTTCTQLQPARPLPPRSRGADLYERHCAVCHGLDGNADNVVADLLRPRPNAFGQGLFKLVSTTNGMPTQDDLVQTLRRGMPGSTMMSWNWMPDEDLQALADEVLVLAVRGRAESIHSTAVLTHQPLSLDEATAIAERELLPGPTVDAGSPIEITATTFGEGERLYRQHCASCHGNDGRGLPQSQDWPTDGTWLWPRDFTSGYLRGAADHRALAFRIRAGMPGAHMPPTMLSTGETNALVGYVKSLIPDSAGDRHVQWRRTVRVARLQQLPAADDPQALTRLDAIRLPTSPLWWRVEACSEVTLRAAHDDREILIQLEWGDETRDDHVRPGARMGDGVAMQFAREQDPPLFAMGSRAQPVNVWRWHAYDPKEVAGMADLFGQAHQGLDAQTNRQPNARTESIELGGIRTVGAATGAGLPLSVTTTWQNGRWRATFRRALTARSDHEVDLGAPGPVLFAIALWNGSIDKHAGSKSITTWHALELER